MKKLITIIFILASFNLMAQTTYELKYDSVIVGKSTSSSFWSKGRVWLRGLTVGVNTDSVVTIRSGKLFKEPRSAFSGGGGTIGYATGNYVGRDGSAGISFDAGLNGRIYTNGNLDLIVSANESVTAATGGLLLKVRNGDGLTIDVNKNVHIPLLATGLTPPSTSGTTKMVVSDTNGLLSFDDIPSGGSGTVNSGTANRLAYYGSTGTAVSELSAITANRALISDANGLPIASSVTNTVLGYLDATSSVQTQIDGKQDGLVSATNIKTINGASILGSGDLVVTAGITLASGAVTPTLTASTNVAGLAQSYANYIRVGDQVTVQGTFRVDFTSGATPSEFFISLPVASALVYSKDLNGQCVGITNSGGRSIVGIIQADTLGGRASVTIVSDASDITTQDFKYSFTYTVI